MQELYATGYETTTIMNETLNKWICVIKAQNQSGMRSTASDGAGAYTALVLAQDEWDMQSQICQTLDELGLELKGCYDVELLANRTARKPISETLTILANGLTQTNRVVLTEKSN